MTITRLLTIDEVAAEANVPKEALRKAADEHGKTMRIGRAVRLHPEDIEELFSLCRVQPSRHASTGAKEKTPRASGKSATGQPASRPAQTAAQRLKDSSRRTSKENIVPMDRPARKN